MECDKACEMISARLDGMLSSADSKMLDRHVASCATCREQQRRMQAIDAVLNAAGMVTAPARLHANVLDRLNRRRRVRRSLVGGFGLAFGSAAVAGVVVLPIGLRVLDMLGVSSALVAALPRTVAQLLPSVGSIGHAATLVASEVLVPILAMGLAGLAVLLMLNLIWIYAWRRLREAR